MTQRERGKKLRSRGLRVETLEDRTALSNVTLILPESVDPGGRFQVRAEGLYFETKVKFQLIRGEEVLDWANERADRSGVAEDTLRVPSRTPLGQAIVRLVDDRTLAPIVVHAISIASSTGGSSPESPPTPPAPVPARQPVFSLPDFPADGRVMEGDWIKADVAGGTKDSAFGVHVVYDGTIVYSHGPVQTNVEGTASVRFQMPYRLLKAGHDQDGLELWLEQDKSTAIHRFTLVKGLEIIVPSEIQEGRPFTYYVRNSAGETGIWAGISYDSGRSHEFAMRETDGSGYAAITENMPRLIQNGADRDGAEFWVRTKDVTWYYRFTIIKGFTPSTEPAPIRQITGSGGRVLFPQTGPNTPARRPTQPAPVVIRPSPAVPPMAPPSEGMNFGRFRQTLSYIHGEMTRNAQSDAVKSIKSARWWNHVEQTAAWTTWFTLVRQGGRWDHKRIIEGMLGLKEANDYYFPIEGDTTYEWYYDVWSNIHYGYVGSAAGFSRITLQTAAAAEDFFSAKGKADKLSVQRGALVKATNRR